MSGYKGDEMRRLFNPDKLIHLLLGFVLFAAGLGTAYLLGVVRTLECERTGEQINCGIATTWMERYPLREERFSPLTGAFLEESCDEDGCTYRVILRAGTTRLPLSSVFSSDIDGIQTRVDQINAFVSDAGQQTLRVKDGGDLVWMLFPLAMFAVGIYLTVNVWLSNLRGQDLDN